MRPDHLIRSPRPISKGHSEPALAPRNARRIENPPEFFTSQDSLNLAAVTRRDEKRGMPDLAILSDSLWRRVFSASPDIIEEHSFRWRARRVVGVYTAGSSLFARQLHRD